MGDYPRIRADGVNLEIELEAGLTIVSYVGDPILVQDVERLWTERDSVAGAIERLSKLLEQDGGNKVDDCVIPLLRGLRQRIDTVVPAPLGEV